MLPFLLPAPAAAALADAVDADPQDRGLLLLEFQLHAVLAQEPATAG
jgi:hypothetical protein